MTEKYEDFTDLITTSFRAIQRIKSRGMKRISLKASDADCIYYLSKYPEGLSNARLVELSGADKAVVSRTLSSLMEKDFVRMSDEDDGKKYGRRYILTASGQQTADGINEKVANIVSEIDKTVSTKNRETFYKVFHSISDELVRLSAEEQES
ncbi:MAG: hypothetical protein IJU93_03495 [Lachnospiraceae bacterium]|nr:hypothetical protein [Lachnospiraceae bacterium]